MSEDIVLLSIEHNIAHVTLNKPDVHNAFDEHVIARLSAIWDELSSRDDVRAVILRGNGKSFSAGADLNWMKRAAEYDEAQNISDAQALADMLHKLYMLPMPTIAFVAGAAMGGGMGLVSCCDIVIADENAKFALSEVKLGLIPATIAPYVLKAMGERQAKRFFQTGERFNGEKALGIGFVHEYAGRPEDAEYILRIILKNIMGNAPEAVSASKKLCQDYAGQEISPALRKDSALRIAQIRAMPEAKEGLAAFFEKRPAAWIHEIED